MEGRVKLAQAVFHPDIIGYGVSDDGLRFGGGDESAEHGLCYPGADPLTLREAVELKAQIGDDAFVIAFLRDGSIEDVDLGHELPIPPHSAPIGWRKGERVTSGAQLRRGHLLVHESMFHSCGLCRNLVEIIALPLPTHRYTFDAHFVDPLDPNRPRGGSHDFAIWEYELEQGHYYRALPSPQGISFGQITERKAA
jgi:hypothetical protein